MNEGHYARRPKPPAPKPPFQHQHIDWSLLTADEQTAVQDYRLGARKMVHVPLRGREFLRRHFPEATS